MSATMKQQEYIKSLANACVNMPVMTDVITREIEVDNARHEIVCRLGIKSWTWIDEEQSVHVETWTLKTMEEWRHELLARVSDIQESVVDSATASAAITALKKMLGRR